MTDHPLTATRLVQKVWQFAHVLKDDGLAFMDYTEQITYLLFLKMAWERDGRSTQIPKEFSWKALLDISKSSELLDKYHMGLQRLSEQPGLIGLIFTKPQSKINDPAKLRRLMELIDSEHWSSLDVDVKGAVYEGLLARNAEDVRGGAGQYFTPRPVIQAVVEVMRPANGMRIADPACGTGGFLVAAYEYLKNNAKRRGDIHGLRKSVVQGTDLVPNVARLCAMNLFLHGIGEDSELPAVMIGDSLEERGDPVDMILTNPPFGRKSSITVVSDDGDKRTGGVSYARKDFWATTSNKQLNFLQHTYSVLRKGGRAAIVVPDNVLFEGGAGERIRRALLQSSRVHTLLRLPAGIWYSPGVKANVLFFDKGVETRGGGTRELWVYDLRSTEKYSLRKRPIQPEDLEDFVSSYCPGEVSRRVESATFKRFSYSEILARDRANLDIRWIPEGDVQMEEKLSPNVLMRQIVDDLSDAIEEFAAVEEVVDGEGASEQ